jgi:hypothetical protein
MPLSRRRPAQRKPPVAPVLPKRLLEDDPHDHRREFIQSLAFSGMSYGRDRSNDSHEDTVRLVLDPDTTINQQPRSYGGLAQWLASGNGIFWVSGKLGSGKSTLMKHLSQDPHVFQLLKSWSRPKPCVVLSYFF